MTVLFRLTCVTDWTGFDTTNESVLPQSCLREKEVELCIEAELINHSFCFPWFISNENSEDIVVIKFLDGNNVFFDWCLRKCFFTNEIFVTKS